MSSHPPFATRPLESFEVPAAVELAREIGVEGVYLHNVLTRRPRRRGAGEMLVLHGRERLLGLMYFGARGNLIVVEREPLDPAAVAAAILGVLWPWRIALARPAVVRELVIRAALRPLVDRDQLYYSVGQGGVPADVGAAELRRADKRDLDALMQAALHLNETDQAVDPGRVNLRWLKRTTRRRIREGSTFVLGPIGAPATKLDIGSRGPGGVVVEGVYTFPEARGAGLAAGLVGAVAREALREVPRVCLHVAADNLAARRSYEKCGMQVAGRCRLMLRE